MSILSAADYTVLDESGASLGSLPSHQTIVKRDTVTQSDVYITVYTS